MGGRSLIESDPDLRAAVDGAIAAGATIDRIVETVRALGADVSRSSVGRYAARFADLAKRQRDLRAMSSAFAEQFGSADDRQGRLLVQLTTNVLTRAALDLDEGGGGEDGEGPNIKALADLARATKDTMSAAKIDIEREARIREEEAKKVRAAAVVAAEAGAREAGASEETIRRVKAKILGLAA